MKKSNPALAVVAAILIAFSASAEEDSTLSTEVTVADIETVIDESVGKPKMVLPSFLTSNQSELLLRAYEIAEKDGHKQPEILQGLLMQETKAGQYRESPLSKKHHGLLQIQLEAARDVLKSFPLLKEQFNFKTTRDAEVVEKLKKDDEFNLTIGSRYLLILKRYGFDTIKELALAFNQGPGGAKNKDPNKAAYPRSVVKHIRSLGHKSRSD